MDPTISQIQIGDTTYNLVDKYDRSQYTAFSNDILQKMNDSNGFNTKIIQKDEKKDELIYITKASDKRKLSQMTINSNDIELKRAKNDDLNMTEQVLFKIHISDDSEIDTTTVDRQMSTDLDYTSTQANVFYLDPDRPIYKGKENDDVEAYIKSQYIEVTLIKGGEESGIFEGKIKKFNPSDWFFIPNSGYGSIKFKSPDGTDSEKIILAGDIVRIKYKFQRQITDSEQYYTLGYRSEQDSIGNFSLAEGYDNIASGNYSHAEGKSNQAIGESSHAEGIQTIAAGQYSHAEGVSSQTASGARGDGAHAEGKSTRAIAQAAHAEGMNTIAGGDASHSGGTNTIAYGDNSFVHGVGTVAKESSQFVIGRYNADSQDSIVIVGNGNEDSKSNAFEITKSGTTKTNNLTIQSPDIEVGKKPSATTVGNHLYFKDQNQNIASLIYPQINTDGISQLVLTSRMMPQTANSKWPNTFFVVGVKSNGDPYFSVGGSKGQPAVQEAFRKSIGINLSSESLTKLSTMNLNKLTTIIDTIDLEELADNTIAVNDIEGILPIPKGGTGATNAKDARTKLGAEAGVWPVGCGGTGVTSYTTLRDKLGAESGIWPVKYGGTGAANKDDARKSLGAKEITVSNKKYKVWTVDQGGTGAANKDDARKNLGASQTNTVGTKTYKGVWPIELGGTGASSKTSALTILGAQPLLKPVASSVSANSNPDTSSIMNRFDSSSNDKISLYRADSICYGKIRHLILTIQIKGMVNSTELANAVSSFNARGASVKKEHAPNKDSTYKGHLSSNSNFFLYTCFVYTSGKIELAIPTLSTAIHFLQSISSSHGELFTCCFTYFVK